MLNLFDYNIYVLGINRYLNYNYGRLIIFVDEL